MKSQKLTYKNSGVNIKNADKFIDFISNLTKKQRKVVILRILVDLEQFQAYQKTLKILTL